jgi:hypothetical protein
LEKSEVLFRAGKPCFGLAQSLLLLGHVGFVRRALGLLFGGF